MSFTSNYSNEKTILIVCQFQKKALIYQKKIVRIFGKKGYKAALKAFSLAHSILTGTSKSYRIVINTKPRPFLPRNQKKICVIVRNTNVGRE